MSVIICAATSDFGIMMSDGRLMMNGIPVKENYEKIWRVSDHLIFGSVGIASIGPYVMNQVIIPDVSAKYNNDMIYEDVYTLCSASAIAFDGTENIDSCLFFLEHENGRSVRIRIIKMSNGDAEKGEVTPTKANKFVYTIAGMGHSEEIVRIIESKLPNLKAGLADGIRYVASINNAVNTTTKYFATRICEQYNINETVGRTVF